MSIASHPLAFQRSLLPKVWGAHRLANYLNIPDGGEAIGESWELSDHPRYPSVVINGPHAGKTLSSLVAADPIGIAGNVPLARGNRFPLLVKFVDSSDSLSVQVHPDDADALALNAPDGGKNEAWFFVKSEPGAKVWVGLAPGKKYTDLESSRAPEEFKQCMRELRPAPGDAIAISAGTIHAIGAGVTVCEVQQTSDITYRVYDWGRPATPDRALHPRESRVSAREQLRPELVKTGAAGAAPAELPSPGFFHWNVRRSAERFTGRTLGRFRIVISLEGKGIVSSTHSPVTAGISRGSVILIPASVEEFVVEPDGEMHWILVEPAPAPGLGTK